MDCGWSWFRVCWLGGWGGWERGGNRRGDFTRQYILCTTSVIIIPRVYSRRGPLYITQISEINVLLITILHCHLSYIFLSAKYIIQWQAWPYVHFYGYSHKNTCIPISDEISHTSMEKYYFEVCYSFEIFRTFISSNSLGKEEGRELR